MRSRARGGAATVAVALLVSACGSEDPAGTARLVEVSWVLDAASITSLAADAPASTRVDLRFEDERASGTSGCNSYGGSYEAGDDGSLTFGGDFMMSQMGCDEPLMALESAYLDALGQVDRFQVSDTGLILEGGAVALTYVEEEPMAALPLEGTAWTLDTVAAGDAVSSALAGTEVTLTLEGGTASGAAGCNRFSGPYTLDGEALSFGALATTKMACPDDVMTQEQAVLTSLDAAAGWTVEGDRLTLGDGDGDLLLGYTGAP